MDKNRKKLIQLRTKLEFYTKLEKKIEIVINAELELEDWASEVYMKRNQLISELDNLKMEMDLPTLSV